MLRQTLHTFLLIDLHLHVEVDAENDQVGDNVEASDAEQNVGVFEGNLLRHLHHTEHDDEVGAAVIGPSASLWRGIDWSDGFSTYI